jgi:hypothetical protein
MPKKDSREVEETPVSEQSKAAGVAFDHTAEDNLMDEDLKIVVKTGRKGDVPSLEVDGKDLPSNSLKDEVADAVRALENAVRRSLTAGEEPAPELPWKDSGKVSR